MPARRLPRQALLVLAACLLASPTARADDPEGLAAGPFLGAPEPDGITIWAVPTGGQRVEALLAREGSADGERRVPLALLAGGMGSWRARIGGLAPGAAYAYRIVIDGEAVAGADGRFRTAPRPGSPFRATFVTASCMDARRDAKQPAWGAALEAAPDLLIHLGDNHYGNSPRREVQWSRFLLQRRVPSYRALTARTPSIAIWDDHDYGRNDGSRYLPGKDEALAVFREVFPQPAYGLREAPGVFFKLSYGDVDLFLLDNRYHRSPNMSPFTRSKTILGAEQWAWLEREVEASHATFKVIASGSTLDASPLDGWRLYKRDRERLFRLVANTPGVLMCTGDVHRSFIETHDLTGQGGYRLQEIVSSGIGRGGEASFATLAFDTTKDDPEVLVTIVKTDADGKRTGATTRRVRLSELQPEAADR